jgi:inosose dehydratase
MSLILGNAARERTERFPADTGPQHVSTCLDVAHLKQASPAVAAQVDAEHLSFAEAGRRGAMVEPPHGIPAMPPVLAALGELDRELFAIVEQDLYPCAPDVPLPIATRTRQYFNSLGVGPGPGGG